jgi:hypothetical protein
MSLSLASVLVVVLGALAISITPPSLEITGYAGRLGEWELTATLRRNAPGWMCELSGPLTMKHIGLCSQDGPEERRGDMRLWRSAFSSKAEATLLIEGVECTFSGAMLDSYAGMIVCPDRRPVPLALWVT